MAASRFWSKLLTRGRKFLFLADQVAEAKVLAARILINQLKVSGPFEGFRHVEELL